MPDPTLEIASAAPELFEAVKYMLQRIGEDPDVYYYCGAGMQAFRLLTKAYAKATGQDVADIENEVKSAARNRREPEVLTLRRQLREIEDAR